MQRWPASPRRERRCRVEGNLTRCGVAPHDALLRAARQPLRRTPMHAPRPRTLRMAPSCSTATPTWDHSRHFQCSLSTPDWWPNSWNIGQQSLVALAPIPKAANPAVPDLGSTGIRRAGVWHTFSSIACFTEAAPKVRSGSAAEVEARLPWSQADVAAHHRVGLLPARCARHSYGRCSCNH